MSIDELLASPRELNPNKGYIDPARNGIEFDELMDSCIGISAGQRNDYYDSYVKRTALSDEQIAEMVPGRTLKNAKKVTEAELDQIYGPCRPDTDDPDYYF